MKELVIADIASYNIDGKSIGHYFSLAHNYKDLFQVCKVAGGPIYESEFCADDLIKLPYDTKPSGNIIHVKYREFINTVVLMRCCRKRIVVIQQSALATFILFLSFLPKLCQRLYIISYDDDCIRSKFKRFFFRMAKKKIDGLICPSAELARKFTLAYCVVPDYIYVAPSNNVLKSKKQGKLYDFCFVGRITPEKGIVEVLSWIKHTKYTIIVSGYPQDEHIGNLVKNAAKGADNITLQLGFVHKERYNAIISSSRFAILNYLEEYSNRSSGVVFDMLFAGVPVVGRRCKALEFIEEWHCGFLFDQIDDFDIAASSLMSKYEEYMTNIQLYINSHKQYHSELRNFLCH